MSNNSSVAFGAGVLIGTPAGGSPVQFGTLQDISVDFSFSMKQLMGQYQFPVAIARGSGKVSGKAKFANIDGPAFNKIFFGNTPTAGQKLWSYNEAARVPSASPYTVRVANAAAFDENLGVAYASSGLPHRRRSTSARRWDSIASRRAIYVQRRRQRQGGADHLQLHAGRCGLQGRASATSSWAVAPTFQIDFYQSNPNIAGAQWSMRLSSAFPRSSASPASSRISTIPELDFEAFANGFEQSRRDRHGDMRGNAGPCSPDPQIDCVDAAVVTLAGREWFVPAARDAPGAHRRPRADAAQAGAAKSPERRREGAGAAVAG